MLSSLWHDIRYGVRNLWKHSSFAAIAILTIALGVGINAGIFSVLNGVAFRDLPVPGSSELTSIHQVLQGAPNRNTHGSKTMVSTSEYRSYREGTSTLSGILGYSPFWPVTLGGNDIQRVNGDLVTCGYFEVLGLKATLGPGLTRTNCSDENVSPVVVLSHDMWRNTFAANPDIVGQTIILNRQRFQVTGVAPEGFRGIEVLPATFFAPITAQKLLMPDLNYIDDPNLGWLQLVGRRGSGTSQATVRANLELIAAQVDLQQPGRKTTLLLTRATSFSMPRERTAILTVAGVIMTAFGLVLLIACANVANLLLARATRRKKEIVVRLAVGASRRRLIQQLLTESMILALAGGLLGSVFAFWTFQGLTAAVLSSLPSQAPAFRIDVTPDVRVFGFAFALTLVTGIVFGLVPALQASKQDLILGMKEDSAGSGRRTGGLLRGALVGVQAAICTLLIIAAGLLLRGVYAAQTVDPGFEYQKAASVSFDLRGAGYSNEEAVNFQAQLMEGVRALPAVVAQADIVPLSPESNSGMFAPPGRAEFDEVAYNIISPEFFSAIGTPLAMGRNFDPKQDAGQGAIIVSEGAARRYWPGANPLDQVLERGVGNGQRITLRVVGIVKDAQVARLGNDDEPFLYFLARPEDEIRLGLIVKSDADFPSMATAIRAQARVLDPDLLVTVKPLEENLTFWRSVSRLVTGLSGSLGTLALILASIGIYGVVSYTVGSRFREIGLRMVLGASRGTIQSMILKQAIKPVLIGGAIGVLASVGVARVLQSVLFGVSAYDPIAFFGSSLFLLGIAAGAALIPAWRASRVDPMVSLRYE